MSQKTDAELLLEAQQIRNETNIGANTAVRVGDMLIDIVDSKTNNAGSGGSSVGLPVPLISFQKGTQNQVDVQFNDTSFLETTTNPEIFLMRWRSKRRGQYTDKDGNMIQQRKGGGFVHPTDKDCATKWGGWKWFNGKQFWHYNGAPVQEIGTDRTTEWTIPAGLMPYQKHAIIMNRYMFFAQLDFALGTPQIDLLDGNIFSGKRYFFKNNQNQDFIYKRAIITGTSRNSSGYNPFYAKTQKYCFVLAVDNPAATQTNGLCPKIFSAYSEPFYASAVATDLRGVPNDVQFLKAESSQYTKIRKTTL